MGSPSPSRPGRRAGRVLVVIDFAEWRGGASSLLDAFLFERESGWRKAVVALNPGPLTRVWARQVDQVFEMRAGRLRDLHLALVAIWRLSRLLRRERPEVILSWMPKAHLYAAPAAVLAGLSDRLAWWQSGGPPDGVDRLATLLPTRGLFAYSRHSAQEQASLWPHRAVTSLQPGIDEPPAPSDAEVEAARRRYGIPEDGFVVGIVGRLQRWKGQDRLLRAVAILRGEGRDAHALIVGGDPGGIDPDYGAELERLVQTLGLSGHVTMTGHLENPAPLFRLMDVMVNASASEPFGLVLLEAMLAGVPVVAVDSGGPAELIAGGEDGLLIPEASEQAIATALRQLLDDPAFRREIAARAPGKVRSHFLTRHFTQRVSEALDHVVTLRRGAQAKPQ